MKNNFMLTPYFLDKAEPGLWLAAQPDWTANQQTLPQGTVQERMAALYQPLAEFVQQTINAGDRPVSVAGDCCTTLSVVAGLQRAGLTPTLLWLDAHGDFNTWETTPSGFLGGMPLAMMVGRGEQTIPDQLKLSPFPEANIILTDARDLDPGERTALADSAVTHLPQVEQLLNFELPPGPLYVHFDVDVLDAAVLPAVSYPAFNGPSVATLGRVFQYLAATEQVTAVSVSAWNPNLDEDGRSREIVMDLLAELIAY
jgi:arginase